MDGYFLDDRSLVSNVVPVDKIHEGMFKPPKKRARDEKEKDSGDVTDNQEDTNDAESLLFAHRKSMRNKQKRLNELGIDFEIAIPPAANAAKSMTKPKKITK